MITKVIEWSLRNRVLVLIISAALAGFGVLAMLSTPIDAIPDLSDVQVIIQTDFREQGPEIVEDQVTYPITSEMLKVPGARVVRGYSFFGLSLVYIIFEDGTNIYWARSRVLEYMNGLRQLLPPGVEPTLGPDATGVGWVFQYTLESDVLDLAELRTLQDWYIRYQLTSVPGVSEVATVGGFTKQYQVEVDPERLRAFGISASAVAKAIGEHNVDISARVLEMGGREYMIRGLGYLENIGDIEQVSVGVTPNGTPIRVADVATVQIGPAPRRGAADLNGQGEVVTGIVVMRYGADALETIEGIKTRVREIQAGLPDGVTMRIVYDRSDIDPRCDRYPQRKTGRRIDNRSHHRCPVPAAFSLGPGSGCHLAPGDPDLVHCDALDWSGCQHHESWRHRHSDWSHGRRCNSDDREHAQAPGKRSGKIGPMGYRAGQRQAGRATPLFLTERLRPVIMTVTAITAALTPILWSTGTGADVMKRVAAPMVGGMVSATVLTLVVIPAVYLEWRVWQTRSVS